MSVALHGNLKDFGLAEVFQLIGQQRKTGALEISSGRVKMRLLFSDGAVVSAAPEGRHDHAALGDMLVRCGLLTREQLANHLRDSENSARSLPALLVASGVARREDIETIEDLLTQNTIFDVLRWVKGAFHFSSHAVPHERPPEKLLAAEQILMDGLRMVDEWQTFAAQVPSSDAVFERSGDFAVYRQTARGDARHRVEAADRVFQLVDGRLSARRVIDLARLGTFEGTRLLAELRQAGLIQLVERTRARRRARADGDGAEWGPRLRLVVATLVPLALLAAVVSRLGPAGSAPAARGGLLVAAGSATRPGIPIPRDPVRSAQLDFERRRARYALEAHRFLRGDWPERLADIDPVAGGRAPALAPEEAGSYYYVVKDGGIVLLSPEH